MGIRTLSRWKTTRRELSFVSVLCLNSFLLLENTGNYIHVERTLSVKPSYLYKYFVL
jgi:hypothetical protein